MKTITKSTVTHKTTVTSDTAVKDGGRALLLELFDDLRSDKRVGKLTAQFAVGGSIASLQFEETESIKQRDIEVEPKPPVHEYI
jgi:hypothetical protein